MALERAALQFRSLGAFGPIISSTDSRNRVLLLLPGSDLRPHPTPSGLPVSLVNVSSVCSFPCSPGICRVNSTPIVPSARDSPTRVVAVVVTLAVTGQRRDSPRSHWTVTQSRNCHMSNH